MADAVVSGAVVSPHDEGLPNISDGDEDWQSAGLQAIQSQAVTSASYVRSDSELTFTGHDAANDQVDVTSGIAYLEIAGETWNVQSTRGGSTPPSYDTDLDGVPNTAPALAVVVPSTVTNLDVQDSTLSDVWLAYATDDTVSGVTAGDVYLRSDDTGGVSAPSHPNVKLGEANPDDASADTLANRGPAATFQSIVTDHLDIESLTDGATKTLLGAVDTSVSLDYGGGLYQERKAGVSTSATTIISPGTAASSDIDGGQFIVAGRSQAGSKSFVDEVLFSSKIGTATGESLTNNSPDGRTYSLSGSDLQLAMVSGTYDVIVIGPWAETQRGT